MESTQTRITKNSQTDLVIGFGEFKGHKYVELREYSTYNNEVEGGVPTKKGVTVKYSDLDVVIKALQACQQHINTETTAESTVETTAETTGGNF